MRNVVCTINGCDRRQSQGGLCPSHHRRLIKFGDPLAGPPIDDRGINLLRQWIAYRPRGEECWEWPRSRNNKGYGKIDVAGVRIYVHRAAFSLAVGPIPVGMVVMHSCDNPPCCNPAHLSVGTTSDNMRDAWDKGRIRPPNPTGNPGGAAVLTPDQVVEIRRMYAAGEGTYTSISKRFGVSNQTILRVVQRRTWKSVA